MKNLFILLKIRLQYEKIIKQNKKHIFSRCLKFDTMMEINF